MRVVLILVVSSIATLAHATDAMRVDGMPVYGECTMCHQPTSGKH
jgi:hypothetical protein